MHKAVSGEESAGLSTTSGPQQRVRGDRAATSALAGSTCVSVRTKVIFFFLLLRLRLRLLSLGKAMHCCAVVVRWGRERDREREAVRTLPNGIKRNRHYAATKATLSRLRLHLRLLRLQLVVVAAVSVVVVVVVFLRFGLTSQRVNNL